MTERQTMKPASVTIVNCIHCGTTITSITHRLNDGFCMVGCDPFPSIKGAKQLLDVVSETEIDSELTARGTDTGTTLHRWLRIKSRRRLRFRPDLQGPMPRLHEGVVWLRGAETLSGIVWHTEWLTADDEWLGENLRFATPEAIAACPAIRDNLQPEDRVLHYRNTDPEGIAEDGRVGLVLVRNRRCALRVGIERKRTVRAPRRDLAQLELGLAELCHP